MRILIKISGEIIEKEALLKGFSLKVEELISQGHKIGIVVGGGNIVRGRDTLTNRALIDHMGMYATVINGIKLNTYLNNSLLCSAIDIKYPNQGTIKDIESNVLIFVGGLGQPYFSTDTAAVLRAIEMKADLMMKMTKEEGVLIDMEDRSKGIYKEVSYQKLLEDKIDVIDLTASALAMQHNLEIMIFTGKNIDNIPLAMEKKIGTVVRRQK